MPKQYEAIRDRLVASGMPLNEAKAEAAATWNKEHPDDPNPWNREKAKLRRATKTPGKAAPLNPPFICPEFTDRLDGYASHLPLLAAALAISTGPVLELGTGMYSTPLLHALCAAQGRHLTSVEFSPNWYRAMLPWRSGLHYLEYVDREECAAERLVARPVNAGHRIPRWSVVLVDQEPAARRIGDLAAFSQYADLFILHDTDNPDYGFEPYLTDHMPHRLDWKLTQPWTSAVSNTDLGGAWIKTLSAMIPSRFTP